MASTFTVIIAVGLLATSMAGAAEFPRAEGSGQGTDVATSTPREEAWVEDLDVARDQFLARDRSYAPASRAQALVRLAALRPDRSTR